MVSSEMEVEFYMTTTQSNAFPLGRAIVGGLIGSIVMAMWAMMVSLFSGMGFWTPVQLIAATWMGSQAMMHVTVGVILTGLMTHMMMGIMLGIVLAGAFAVFRIPTGSSRLLWGIGYAIVVWIVNQYAVLPIVDPLMASHMPPWAFALAHMMFGVVAAAFLLHSSVANQRNNVLREVAK